MRSLPPTREAPSSGALAKDQAGKNEDEDDRIDCAADAQILLAPVIQSSSLLMSGLASTTASPSRACTVSAFVQKKACVPDEMS